MPGPLNSVTLRFEIAYSGATQQLGKLADNASKATDSNDLRGSLNPPSGGWGGFSPISPNLMGFPLMAGGYHGPTTGGGFNFSALAGAAYPTGLTAHRTFSVNRYHFSGKRSSAL